jgi:NDP-sugar pyrophosphorylase family protein
VNNLYTQVTTTNHSLLPVVILAGGLATRLGSMTHSRPKCLVDVAGQPFLFHQLQRLKADNVSRVVLCLGHLGEQVQAAVGDGSRFGLQVEYSFDGPELIGTAGAIRRALPLLPSPFFVLYGDSYLTCSFRATQSAFESSGRKSLMTVFKNDGRWDTSNVDYCNGEIIAYDKDHRTPGMRHIDYGLGLFHHTVFASLAEGRAYDLATVYQQQLREHQLAAFEVFDRFYEIGSHAGLEETRTYLGRSTSHSDTTHVAIEKKGDTSRT